jgi:hypothetical protein
LEFDNIQEKNELETIIFNLNEVKKNFDKKNETHYLQPEDFSMKMALDERKKEVEKEFTKKLSKMKELKTERFLNLKTIKRLVTAFKNEQKHVHLNNYLNIYEEMVKFGSEYEIMELSPNTQTGLSSLRIKVFPKLLESVARLKRNKLLAQMIEPDKNIAQMMYNINNQDLREKKRKLDQSNSMDIQLMEDVRNAQETQLRVYRYTADLGNKFRNANQEISEDEKHIESYLKTIKKKLKKKMNQSKEYKEYVKLLKNVQKLKGKIEVLDEEIENLKTEQAIIEKKIKYFDRDVNEFFTIPRDHQEKLEHMMDNYEYIRKGLKEMNDGTLKQNPYHNKDMTFVLQFFLDKIDDKFSTQEQAIQSAADLTNLEGQVDQFLGKVFAKIQKLPNSRKCFTLEYLSYLIFYLCKINIILFEKSFLNGFFNEMDYPDIKEFAMHNYKLFTTESFVKKQLELNDFMEVFQEKCSRDQKQFRDNYVNNWSFILMTYKEFTQFGTQTSGSLQGVGFGNVIGNFCKSFVQEVFAITKQCGAKLVANAIIKLFVKQLEIVLQIPILKEIVVFLITKLITTVVMLIYNLVMKKLNQSVEVISKGFNSLYHQLSAGEGVYYLAYQKYLNSDSEIEEQESSDFEKAIDVKQIEQVYRESIATISLISMSKVFHERENTINILKLRNESFMESVEKIKETLTPLNQKNFEDIKRIETENSNNPLLNEIIKNYFRRACTLYQQNPEVIGSNGIIGEDNLMDAISMENPYKTKDSSEMQLTDLNKKIRKLKDHENKKAFFKLNPRSVVKKNVLGFQTQTILNI